MNYWEQLRFAGLLDNSRFVSIQDQYDDMREFFKESIVEEMRSEWEHKDYTYIHNEGRDEVMNDIYEILHRGWQQGRDSDDILNEISDYLD